jgi:hypothetical protein
MFVSLKQNHMKTLVKISALSLAVISLTACEWFNSEKPHAIENIVAPIDTTAKNTVPDSSIQPEEVTANQPDSTKKEKAQ